MDSLDFHNDLFSGPETNTYLDVPLFKSDSCEYVIVDSDTTATDPEKSLLKLKEVLKTAHEKYLNSIFKDYIWCYESMRLRIGNGKTSKFRKVGYVIYIFIF